MSRFDRYMLSQLMMIFGFFALVLVSVYWVNSAVRLFDRLISDNQSVWVFLEMTALSLPNVVRLMLPVAAFAAVLYVMNRMAGESELVVVQATGFSPWRLMRPVLWFGVIVALMISVLAHLLVPMARTRLNERDAEIAENMSSRLLSEGRFLHPADQVTLYIRAIDQSGELNDIFLSDSRGADGATIYTARRAFLVKSGDGPKLVMFNGMAQNLRRTDAALTVTRFADFTYDIAALIAARGPRTPALEERMTPALLAADDRLLAETGATRAEALFEGHDRFAKPLLAAAAALIAFAAMLTGTYTRFGLWRQIAFASGLFIALFFLTNVADKAAQGAPDLVWLGYLPALAGFGAAAALLAWGGRGRTLPSGAGGAVPA